MNPMQRRRMQAIMAQIRKRQFKDGDARKIVFLIVDDTCCKKDRATKKMKALSFQDSHEECKSVWCHNLVITRVVSGGQSYAFDFRPYYQSEYCEAHQITFKTKNDLAVEMIVFPANDDERSAKSRTSGCCCPGKTITPHRPNRRFVSCVPIFRWILLRFSGIITYAGTSRRGIAIFKELLGFDQYQLLSFKEIQRFWAVQFLADLS